MVKSVVLTAGLTGTFCAVFAVGIDLITEVFSIWQLMLISFASGSLGSLFAHLVMRSWHPAKAGKDDIA